MVLEEPDEKMFEFILRFTYFGFDVMSKSLLKK